MDHVAGRPGGKTPRAFLIIRTWGAFGCLNEVAREIANKRFAADASLIPSIRELEMSGDSIGNVCPWIRKKQGASYGAPRR